MGKVPQRLGSPDFWVRVFTALAAIGMTFAVAGFVTERRLLVRVGFWLGVPLLLAATVMVAIVIFVSIIANRRK